MDSNVGLAIQCGGVFLITLLSIFMRSSIKSNALRYWIASWASLSVSLLSLFLGFYSAYFFGEYIFGLLFIAGCRSQMTGASLTPKHRYLVIPVFIVSLVLPHVSSDFNDLFVIHSAILAVLFLVTVMVLMESVRREVEMANKKLELLVQMDPLTEALNRHAFHSLLRSPETGQEVVTSGSVAVLDIDNLKPINDTMGHTVGDKAIRAVARAMRSLVRADDMLFRWGGDEFLVLMFKLPQPEASRRIAKLNKILEENAERWIGQPVTVTVSFGVAGFTSLTDLGQAIEQADKAMYAQRNHVRGIATKGTKVTK
ncbi:MAG TPA: GGDEF domain-containing protein [Pyrinomonadaceae bacterium]|nr:GGDEF domain-containing protein [Pyrinomonadaceae bacterium]